jgi:hypothetical protein
MTYEFFKEHNREVLTDEAIDLLWNGGREDFDPGVKDMFAGDPEDEHTAAVLRRTSLIFALVHPEYLRGEEAAA